MGVTALETYYFSFAKSFKDKILEFIEFIFKCGFSIAGDYQESWNFIKKDLNSLNRYTDLAIGFPVPKEEAEKQPKS